MACVTVKAQHFKANFSITVALMCAVALLCFDYLKKDNIQDVPDQGGEMLGHISLEVLVKHLWYKYLIVINMQNGSVLLTLLLIDVKKQNMA